MYKKNRESRLRRDSFFGRLAAVYTEPEKRRKENIYLQGPFCGERPMPYKAGDKITESAGDGQYLTAAKRRKQN